MLHQPVNPYQDMIAVRHADMLFGRMDEFRRLYGGIANRQSISVVGLRHIGKSSILMHMLSAKMQQQFPYDLSFCIFVLLDLRTFRQKTCDYFFDSVCEQVVAQAHENLNLTTESYKGADGFGSLVQQIARKGFHLVLLMDAFDNVARNEKFDMDFFSFLRSQAYWVSYVTASIAPVSDICHQEIKESPFFNIFDTLTIGPLAHNEAEKLILQPAQRAQFPFTEEEKEWILDQAGRHPFFVQRVCHLLFEEKCQRSIPDFDCIEEDAYNELRRHFPSMFDDLPLPEQEKLEDQIVYKHTQQLVPELSESALFRRFMYDKHPMHHSSITVEEVEKVLSKINDQHFLGKCELQRLRIVSTHLDKTQSLTFLEIGKVVRRILNEALERLKGDGVRSDSAADWKNYNILYYCYFKYRLKNEHVSSRLEYSSLRQYYRDKKKAIEALMQALLEMEEYNSPKYR